ncbi:alpha-1,3-mannosyltransferase ALG3 isoform d, variant [Capsaspora owczarzaki ATCC 30864]|nr:alpha-1,3-mannosyltransferase ALG3 isoform d, variant [Capsaspora owczarzaki ATCC 30864]
MDEVKGAIDGERDYTLLKGDTGPLVYPAGFVYLFGAFYYMTENGTNIFKAQLIYAVLYMLTLTVVLAIYQRARTVPPYALLWLTFTSYRIHSIFVLRLFNDPIAMLLFYVAVLLFMHHRWYIGCVFYSLAVSIKMNILLSAPALLLLLLSNLGVRGTVPALCICAVLQVLLGLPFLMAHPVSYLSRSFELTRQFFFKWTVNWRFVGEDLFLDRRFHLALLGLHLFVLAVFATRRWIRPDASLSAFLRRAFADVARPQSFPSQIALALFVSNFAGIVFARSLHYQFYVWYYHTLPFLLWSTRLPTIAKFAVLAAIEYSWNVYPSTDLSSGLLLVAHQVLLFSLIFWPEPSTLTPVVSKATKSSHNA